MEDRLIENKAYRVILAGVSEIVGENGLKSVLNFTGLTKYIDNLPAERYREGRPTYLRGGKAGYRHRGGLWQAGRRAILFQVGRMQAKWGLEENPDITKAAREGMAGMSDLEQARIILNYMASATSKQLNTESRIEEDGEVFFYHSKAAAHCFERESKSPVCYTTAGFVDGLVAWATGGHTWKVEETECMAMGHPCCTFRVRRKGAD
jgi:predicted hydrocarbon binding protein